jgi:hypothetical protein
MPAFPADRSSMGLGCVFQHLWRVSTHLPAETWNPKNFRKIIMFYEILKKSNKM